MKFYGSVESMRNHPPSYSDPFILQWEIPNPRDGIERKYIVFDGVSEYWKMHSNNRYTTCHEVFISQAYNVDDDIAGHPAFDFDLKLPPDSPPALSIDDLYIQVGVPHDWTIMLQDDIISILCKQYPTMEDEILRLLSDTGRVLANDNGSLFNPWVWMSSPSMIKLSKHLVISAICFAMWRTQMGLLVKELLTLDRPYIKCIDEGILRRLGSLRLPLNHKRHIHGEPDMNGIAPIVKYSPILTFDDKGHKFTDGLILIHDANMYSMKNGVLLSPSDLAPEYQEQLSNVYGIYNAPSVYQDDNSYGEDESDEELIIAFNKINRQYHTGLVPGRLKGKYLPLIRKEIGVCPVTSKKHGGDNAFCFKKDGKVYYKCHRGCSLNIGGFERKYIDITPWKGNNREDIARLANEDVNKMIRKNDEE